MLTIEQLALRKSCIGGSDMPIILGLSSYKTPYQLYLEKISDDVITQEESPQQYWGSQLEGVIREEFAKRNNVEVVESHNVVHPLYDYMRGNLDGYIPSLNAVLEVKCSNQFMAAEWGESYTDVIPLQYIVQVAWYCMLTNADCAYIAVLIGGHDYREYKYQRDFALEEDLIAKAKTFWRCVQLRQPPAPVNQSDLRLMYPKHDPAKTVTIAEPIADQLTTLVETRYKIKELSEVEDQYKFNIMQFMQDAECLVDAEGKPIVTWKANKRGARTFLMKGL
jgi:putative phage-type endonuclease